MVRRFYHYLLERKENILNNRSENNKKQDLEEEDDKNIESKIQKAFWSFSKDESLKHKPQTYDVAVGPDESRASTFFRCIGLNKYIEQQVVISNEPTINRFVHSVQKEALIATREVVASTCSSIFSVFFSHPFDVIKSNYQVLRYPRTIRGPLTRRRKFFYVIRHIYMTKGLKRFYKNLWKSQHESALHVVSVFWTYQRVHQFFEENFENRNEDAVNFLAGLISASIPVLVLGPFHNYLERNEIKHKLLRRHGKSVAENFPKQLRYWRPLYRGNLPAFLHMSVQYGLKFMFYHKIRAYIAQRKTTVDKATDMNPYVTEVDSIINFSHYELLLAGALAAVLGDIIAHPLEVIRSRLAMTTLMRQQYRYEHTCRSILQCAILILRKERFAALYAGLTPSLIRSSINTALTFAAYEKMRDWLRPFFST